MMELTVAKAGRVVPATLVSIVPFKIVEDKPGLIPGHFEIPASKDGRPQCKIVSEAFHDVYIDAARGTMRVKNPPYEVARSVVYDYLISQLEISDEAHPGFFYLEGEWTTEEVEKKCAAELIKYRGKQKEWFKGLVMRADDDWEKTRSHFAISDIQRYAAKELGLERPWLIKTDEDPLKPSKMIKCPSCTSPLSSEAVVCPHCNCVIDREKYKSLQFVPTGR